MNEKVSIVIPAYNAEKYIRRTIESVENQIYQDIEIVVVDDKSSDNTVKICKELIDVYPNVKLIERQENGGQLPARNDGINASKGDWILFLDSDDVLSNTVIQKFMNKAQKFDPDIIFGCYETVKESGERVEFRADISEGLYTSQEFGRFLFNKMPINVLTCVGSKLYKAEFVKKRKDFTDIDVKTNADMAFVIDALLSCKNIYYYDEICYTYLLRSGSITYSYRQDMYSRICFARRRIREYLEYCRCYEEKRKDLELMQYTLIRKALRQEVKYKKGFKQFKIVLKEIAETERTMETAQVILKEDKNLIHKAFMFCVMHKISPLLYVISLKS